MARKSTKENKNICQLTREALDLTLEEAFDLLVTMSPERIEKIEGERSMPIYNVAIAIRPCIPTGGNN